MAVRRDCCPLVDLRLQRFPLGAAAISNLPPDLASLRVAMTTRVRSASLRRTFGGGTLDMAAALRFGTVGLCFVTALAAARLALAAESLPMPARHYAELCRQSGGGISINLNGSFGTAECQWPDQGKTECKVDADQVNACAIQCESPVCLKANPDRFNPSWPLAGGPGAPAPGN
jgi:hypothetical protein